MAYADTVPGFAQLAQIKSRNLRSDPLAFLILALKAGAFAGAGITWAMATGAQHRNQRGKPHQKRVRPEISIERGQSNESKIRLMQQFFANASRCNPAKSVCVQLFDALYELGVTPVHRRKARWKFAGEEKPTSSEISSMLLLPACRSRMAMSRRRPSLIA